LLSHAAFLHQTLDVHLPSAQTKKQECPDYGYTDLGANQEVHKADGPHKHQLRDMPFGEAAYRRKQENDQNGPGENTVDNSSGNCNAVADVPVF
jgi:hypothetical protein